MAGFPTLSEYDMQKQIYNILHRTLYINKDILKNHESNESKCKQKNRACFHLICFGAKGFRVCWKG